MAQWAGSTGTPFTLVIGPETRLTGPMLQHLAQARRDVFVEPVTRRNRVWQADFSEFETGTEGVWRLGGIVDYAAKVVLGYSNQSRQGQTPERPPHQRAKLFRGLPDHTHTATNVRFRQLA